MKYRKKPLIVEAYQWHPDMKDAPGVRYVQANTVDLSKTRGIIVDRPKRHVIDTQSGEVALEAGDWVIKGIVGEYYPCKPDIFARTYEDAAHAAATTVDGAKLVLGPRLKQWLQKTAIWGAEVKRQETTISKRFLLNVVKDLTAMANDILITEQEVSDGVQTN